MAQFEIEIKLPLKNLKETLKFLTDQGFQETAQIQEKDTYFNSVYHDVKKRDEALRIRTSTDCRSGISKTQINFKGPKLDKISMSRMELETEVSDAEVLKNILIHFIVLFTMHIPPIPLHLPLFFLWMTKYSPVNSGNLQQSVR